MTLSTLEYLSAVMPDECTEVHMSRWTRMYLWSQSDALRYISLDGVEPPTFRARPIVQEIGLPDRMVFFVTAPGRTWSVGWSE